MFTSAQLQYLCQIQGLEDWTSDYFPIAVAEFFNTDFVPAITHEEYRDMQKILSRATNDDLWNLQRALDHFNLLSVSMFENKEKIK
jgi:hypothetical protein